MTKIRTTHVGSLIRPAELTPYLEAIEEGQPYDEAAFAPKLAEAVAGVVKHQADIGLDVIDDGEYGKASWITYFYDRVSGMEKREVPLDENNTLEPETATENQTVALPVALKVLPIARSVPV